MRMANKRIKKIIAVFVIGGILFGAATSVNAYAQSSGTSTLKNLVQNFKEPVKKAMSAEDMNKNMKTKLDPLVKAGTITQSQEDKIITFMKAKRDQRTAEMEKVKKMTEAERKIYFGNRAKNKSDMLSELVKSSVISQTQADEIKKVIGKKGFKGQRNSDNKINRMKNNLDPAVKNGTITQAQEDKILAYIKQLHDSRKAEMDKVKAMTEADRKAYFESKGKTARIDIFSELVSAGTITQAQADKLKSMMPACPKGAGFGKHGDNEPYKEKQSDN